MATGTDSGIVVVTLALVVVTLLLVLATLLLAFGEARGRASQRRAEVVVHVWPFTRGPMYLEVRLENFGPANARDVRLEVLTEDPEGQTVPDSEHRLAEGGLAAGRHRTILALPGNRGDLRAMATAGYVVVATWSWTDDRSLLPFRSGVQRRTVRTSALAVQDSYYPGHVMIEPTIDELLRDIRDDIRLMRKAVESRPATAMEQRHDRVWPTQAELLQKIHRILGRES